MIIQLNHDKFTIIDDEDYDLVASHKWRYKVSTGYAMCSVYDKEAGKRIDIMLHRVINKTPKGMDTDHINRNRLDNRKSNLETVTRRENTLRGISPPAINASKTRCIRGHEFTPENTKKTKKQRMCLICKRAQWRAYYYQRKKAEPLWSGSGQRYLTAK